MARTDTLKNFLTDIADEFREKLGIEGVINHSDYDTKIDDVYDKGVSDGKKHYLDEMWEEIQQSGNRKDYTYAFGSGFHKGNFKPKYDFILTGCNGMFFYFGGIGYDDKYYMDLVEIFNECKIRWDTSKCPTFAGFLANARVLRVPTIDATGVSNTGTLGSCFQGASKLHTIEKIILHKNISYNTATFDCVKLKNIVIEGEIGKDIWFNRCELLTKESITSIVTHLSDTQGATLTLSETAVNNAFTTDEWIETIADKVSSYNGVTYDGLWTISLV